MPSKPLTIILNANHAKKFATLGPRISGSLSAYETILKESRNKFRQKELSTIYLKGGTEFQAGEELDELISEIYVAKDEPYCGPPSSGPQNHGETRFNHINSYVDAQASTQLRSLASLPGVHFAIGMPDLHPGSRFPIGCSVIADGIYPALVGSDIGCGIGLYRLASPNSSIPTPEKLASKLRGLDDPWDGDTQKWLQRYGITKISSFDANSLGTVGAGNHFAEICKVEHIRDDAISEALHIEVDSVCLLGTCSDNIWEDSTQIPDAEVHTGSRGIGGSILQSQTRTESNPYLQSGLNDYLEQHDYAVNWAIANRDLVALRIKRCLFGAENTDQDHEDPHVPLPSLGKIVEVTHNSVMKSSFPINGDMKDMWIHRKGAAAANCGIVPCAGSRGTYSWLVEPQGDGIINGYSLPHGAGRRHARSALRGGSLTKSEKASLITTSLGSHVVCTDPDLLLEERPEAYKSIDDVMSDIKESGIGEGVVKLRPLVSYKVREGAERRG